MRQRPADSSTAHHQNRPMQPQADDSALTLPIPIQNKYERPLVSIANALFQSADRARFYPCVSRASPPPGRNDESRRAPSPSAAQEIPLEAKRSHELAARNKSLHDAGRASYSSSAHTPDKAGKLPRDTDWRWPPVHHSGY